MDSMILLPLLVVLISGSTVTCCISMARVAKLAPNMRRSLEEHQPQWVLAIDMHGMGDAAGLRSRTVEVLPAQSKDLIEGVFPRRHAAGHYASGCAERLVF